jgi:hypothetical protein
MLKRIGTVGATGVAVTGSASATTQTELNVDREIDVADVSGTVTLESVLSEADLERLPFGVDPATTQISVAADADTIQPSGCCCCECTYQCAQECPDDCCFC